MKLYVKNLSADVDDQAVKKLFAEFGRVESARVISDKTDGHSKMKAVVKMGSDAEGKDAIAGLHGFSVNGSRLEVTDLNSIRSQNVVNHDREPIRLYGSPRSSEW